MSALSVPEIQALSFHDPSPFRVDPATIPDGQKAIMAANGAALAVYAGTPAMADPSLLGRLSGIAIPTLVLWGESDQVVEPGYGQAYAAAIPGARFEVLPASGHMPQMETPDLVLQAIRGSGMSPRQSRPALGTSDHSSPGSSSGVTITSTRASDRSTVKASG